MPAPEGSSDPQADLLAYLDATFPEVDSLETVSTVLKALKKEHDTDKKVYEELRDSADTRLARTKDSIVNGQQLVDKARSSHEQLKTQLQEYNDTADDRRDNKGKIKALCTQISKYEQTGAYLRMIEKVEQLHRETLSALEENPADAIAPFMSLVEAQGECETQHWTSLHKSVADITHSLQVGMSKHLEGRFTDAASSMGWPGLVDPDSLPPSEVDAFENALRDVIKFDEACTASDSSESSGAMKLKEPPLVIRLLLQPIEKRFRYHFHSDRQTNRIDKPEWFFAQVVSYIRTHTNFLSNTIQPLLALHSSHPCDATTRFINGLVMSIHFKLVQDMPELVQKPELLIHAVNECMAFDQFLHSDFVMYPPTEPGSLSLFTEKPDTFQLWIDMEHKRVNEQVSDIFEASSSPWSLAFDIADITLPDDVEDDPSSDQLKVTQAAEKITALLELLTERFSMLEMSLQLKFVQHVQMPVLETLYKRLSTETDSLFSFQATQGDDDSLHQYAHLANSLEFVHQALRDSVDSLEYVELHEYASKHDLLPSPEDDGDNGSERGDGIRDDGDDMEGTLFDAALDEFEELGKTMLDKAVNLIVRDFERNMAPYLSQRLATVGGDAHTQRTLSPEMCEPIAELKHQLLTLERALTKSVFARLWRRMMTGICNLLVDCVFRRTFTRNAALQFEFDVQSVHLVFSSYCKNPAARMHLLREAIELLTLRPQALDEIIAVVGPASYHSQSLTTKLVSKGAGLLSKLTHKVSASSDSAFDYDEEAARAALQEVNVFRMTVGEAARVCGQRIDVSSSASTS